jgi:hypothetical protein
MVMNGGFFQLTLPDRGIITITHLLRMPYSLSIRQKAGSDINPVHFKLGSCISDEIPRAVSDKIRL